MSDDIPSTDQEFEDNAEMTGGELEAESVEHDTFDDDSAPNDYDGDNDPSPGDRLPKHEYSGAAKCQPQRLAKILAAAGIDARRKCEEYVTSGRVTVDGEVVTDLAFRADPYSQKIELDGEKIKLHRKVYFVLNKPRGVVCTNFDPAGRPRVIDLFPQFKERLFTIGRLDEESEGLLLVTNDGELANRMAHPRYRVPKFYLCHVKGVPSSETLADLKRGMYFEEGRFSVEGARLKKVVGDSAYLDIVLNEGQNREIRRLMARVNHKVMRLKRVGFGPIRLGDLPAGAFRPLTVPEVNLLNDLSQQRAHLDNTAGRGRKKKFGDKPRFGNKPFGVRRSDAESSFGDRPPRRRFVSQTDDEVIGSSESEERGPRTPRRPRGDTQRGEYQGGQRRYSRRDDERQTGDQAPRQRRYVRRDDDQQQGDSQERPRRYGQGNRQGGQRGYGQGGPRGQRRYSNGDGNSLEGYSSRPPRGNRPPRRYQSDQAGESFQAQAQSNDGEFNGGRRRFVTDETPESSFNRRPARGGGTGGARPQRRRYVRDENSQDQQEQSGGYSAQRRPARGPRRNGQAGNRELPARGQRGSRNVRPPKPTTADGKEILQGRVTGYRSLTKDGPARRRRNAIQGMQVNRQQRQQRRKKTED
jgi:23S rRNA pseudouridine2605 synthase